MWAAIGYRLRHISNTNSTRVVTKWTIIRQHPCGNCCIAMIFDSLDKEHLPAKLIRIREKECATGSLYGKMRLFGEGTVPIKEKRA